MATSKINILIFNGDVLNKYQGVKARSVGALRTELDIGADETITVNGRNVEDGYVLDGGEAVAWGLAKKRGG